MITKEKLTEIVQKSVEDAWYNRRSLNPVKEQTEIIVSGIMEQLNKPAVMPSVCNHIYDDFNGFMKCIYCSIDKPEQTEA